jgi:photosystem II stability/assembly factor-like uncharacterized protein
LHENLQRDREIIVMLNLLPKHPSLRVLFLILFCALGSVQVAADTGRWGTHGPNGGSVTHVAVSSSAPNVIFAGSASGLNRSTDGGAHWHRSEVGLPLAPFVRSIALGTQDPVMFVSTYNAIYKSTNSGLTWQYVDTPAAPGEIIYEVSLRPGSATDVIIGTATGAYISHDGGDTWSGPSPNVPSFALTNVHYAEDGAIYLGKLPTDIGAFEAASLLKSTDGGANWVPLESASYQFVGTLEIATSPVNPQYVFVHGDAGIGGVLLFSANAGVDWSVIDLTGPSIPCAGLDALVPDPTLERGLFLSCGDSLIHANDATLPTPEWTIRDGSNGLVGESGNALEILAAAVHPGYPGTPEVWVGTGRDGVYHSTDAGENWTAENEGLSSISIRALAPHPSDIDISVADVFAGSDSAAPMYKSNDAGNHWAESTSGLAAQWIRSIAIDPTSTDTDPSTSEAFTIYAAGRTNFTDAPNAGIYKSTDAGATWNSIGQGITVINGHPDMGAVRNILLDPDSCNAPPCVPGSSPLQTVYVAGSGRSAPPGTPYLSARIYKSVDAGANWVAADEGLPEAQTVGPPEFGDYVADYIVPMAMDPMTPSTLYVGTLIDWDSLVSDGLQATLPNGVFKSIDAGESWVHSSNGLPRCGGPGTSHCDVFALAVNPVNPQILLAGLVDYSLDPPRVRIYRSVDAAANWASASWGIAGTVIRSLAFEADGSAAYAGVDGTAANPGGVFRSTDGGIHWNSMNQGLPANSALALSIPPRAFGAPTRLLLGTDSGVWEHTIVADDDNDGVPDSVEGGYFGGDGNGDSKADSIQADVATLVGTYTMRRTTSSDARTVSIVHGPGACAQLDDVSSLEPGSLPQDIALGLARHSAFILKFSLPGCSGATVRVNFHGATFGDDWVWRNYGPTVPGDDASFAWYTFTGATRVDADTWELSIDAERQGNYRDDPQNILFVGGPVRLPVSHGGLEVMPPSRIRAFQPRP